MHNRRVQFALALIVIGRVVSDVPPALAQQPSAHPSSSRRIVHHFDFDERGEGNLEDIPKYWEAVRPVGFPYYALGAFDFHVGRETAPSLHLASEGRNVAVGYNGPDTRVRANTDYRLVAFIRPDRLRYARACLSAHYIDGQGRPIISSLVRSRYVGNPDELDQWVEVELNLPRAPSEAISIGLTGWVVQEPVWSDELHPKRHIQRNDVRGGAWFDDITIYSLPRIELSTSTPTNTLTPDDPQELYALLADHDDFTLRGRLTIRSVGGPVVDVHKIDVVTDPMAKAYPISIAGLPPGLYRAEFDVFSGDRIIRSKSLTFAKLAKLSRDEPVIARAFGVVINPDERVDPSWELSLLERQAVHSVKVPVWSGLVDEKYTDQQRQARHRLVQNLVKRGFALTGVFLTPPASIIRSDGAYARPLLELLAGDRSVWNDHLAAAVAPNASAFRWWEIAARVETSDEIEGQLDTAVTQLREAMRPFITLPRLSIPIATTVEFTPRKLPVEQITLRFGSGVDPDFMRLFLESAAAVDYEHIAVLVEPLPTAEYLRLPRLADWSRRLITARHLGADTVFVPQTWRARATVDGPVVEPREEFLVLRTIADVLGNALPGPVLRLDEGVRCLSFASDKSSVLVLWDERAPAGGRFLPIQLGTAERQIDLWGRVTTLKRGSDGRQIVKVGRSPVLIPDVERWLVEFRSSLSIKPDLVPSGSKSVRHDLDMVYAGDRAVSGRIEWELPQSWSVFPRSFDFALTRERSVHEVIEVAYPHNMLAGASTLLAKITLAGDGGYMEVPLRVLIAAPDLEVSGMAFVEQGELILRQVVINRSQEVLSFRASAVLPGHRRQYRPISNLRPGDTHTVQYRFAGGEAMIGRRVRLALREVNDGPRIHNLEIQVP